MKQMFPSGKLSVTAAAIAWGMLFPIAAQALPVYIEGPDRALHQVTRMHHECLKRKIVQRPWWDIFVPLPVKCSRALIGAVRTSLACFNEIQLTLDSGEVLRVSSASPLAEYLAATTLHPDQAPEFFDVPSNEHLSAVLLLTQEVVTEGEVTPFAIVTQFDSGKVRSRSLVLGSRGRFGLARGVYTHYFERRLRLF